MTDDIHHLKRLDTSKLVLVLSCPQSLLRYKTPIAYNTLLRLFKASTPLSGALGTSVGGDLAVYQHNVAPCLLT